MAVESAILASDDWFIGEDHTFRFFVTKGSPIVIAVAVAVGDTTITVAALKEAVTSGDKIRFGRVILTTTSAADAGDTSLAVSTTISTIPVKSVGHAIQDVTGWSFDFTVKVAPNATANILNLTPSIATANEGDVTVPVLDTETDALEGRTYYYKFRRSNAGSETVLAYGDAVLRP